MKGGFGSDQLPHGSSSDKSASQPTYTPTKPKEPQVDPGKLKLANSLFQQVINPAPKFKGPEMKKKNVSIVISVAVTSPEPKAYRPSQAAGRSSAAERRQQEGRNDRASRPALTCCFMDKCFYAYYLYEW